MEKQTQHALAQLLADVPDASQVAAVLLQNFGSLNHVLRASPTQLQELQEIGPTLSQRIHATGQLVAVACQEQLPERVKIGSDLDVANHMMHRMGWSEQEEFWVIIVDAGNYIRREIMLYRGNYTQITVQINEILSPVLRSGVAQFFVVHNHPSGNVQPSSADLSTTQALLNAAQAMDLILLDHVIVGSNKHYSMKSYGVGGFKYVQ